MKKILIVIFLLSFSYISVFSDEKNSDKIQRRSQLNEPSDFGPWQTSYPYPFEKVGTPLENPKNEPAISTGYYFVQNGDPADKPWRPDYMFVDTTENAAFWKRILSGPNQRDTAKWREEGAWRFFRDPYDDNIFNGTDSTDNAVAGPIPIGFKFNFNGLDYDSFYVSTNGGIILGNDRYYYENYWYNPDSPVYNKTRKRITDSWSGIPSGTCYNTHSGDWYSAGRIYHSGDGINDGIRDDWGWQCAKAAANKQNDVPTTITCGGQPVSIIAPFWGDGYLRQWDNAKHVPLDQGRVYYYKDTENKKLIIYFVEWQLIDTLTTHFFTNYIYPGNSGADTLEPWENNYITANVQVVLDGTDSSVTFNYERFRGRAEFDKFLFEARHLIRINTYSGVFGFARHLNYESKAAKQDTSYKGTIPWAGQYAQSTCAWGRYMSVPYEQYPNNTQSFKYKQWKNTLRVVDISFRVRKMVEGATDFSEAVPTSKAQDYEVLAGHETIGQIQPVVTVQNLSNDIQGTNGVNYQPQDLNFRVRCSIVNQQTRRALYNKYVKVDSLAIAKKIGEAAYAKNILSKVSYNGKDYTADTMHSDYYDANNHLKTKYDGIPPYGFVQIYFPPFEPNELFLTHIGLMRCFAMLDPTDPRTSSKFGDMWPFDDTLNVRFWVMRHIHSTENFYDDVTEYHIVPDDKGSPVPIPSVYKWVNLGAIVMSGESVSNNPLPPRGDFPVDNDELFPESYISSPVIKMQRPYSVGIQQWGGNEIRSYPINMYSKFGSIFTLSVQRATYRPDWERGWSDGQLIGCEHRVVASSWYKPIQEPDELRVEFALPTPRWQDGASIANIPEENWRYHLRRGGAPPERNMSAYTLFGGGGYMVGFLETDKDSALPPPVYSAYGRNPNGLRYNFYDDGIDFEYQKVFIPIPDTIINAPNEGAKYFRFRIKEYAKNHQRTETSIPDDEDPFYIDNIGFPINCCAEIEMSKVSVEWPYTMVPASQAVAIPIRLKLSNNTSHQAPSFWVRTKIFKKSDFDYLYFLQDAWIYRGDPSDSDKVNLFRKKNQESRDSARFILFCRKAVYCSTKQMPFLRPGSNEPVSMSNWNARLSPPGDYVVWAQVYVPGGDDDMSNDTNYSDFTIRFGPMMTYHPITNYQNCRIAGNDMRKMLGYWCAGMNLHGYNKGGLDYSDWKTNFYKFEAGEQDGGNYGQIATKFELSKEDTISGYGAYFVACSGSPDYIEYRMYTGINEPECEIQNSKVQSLRGKDDIADSTMWDQFVFDTLPKPIILEPGTYWVSITQPGETGLRLGASSSKSGMRCTNVYYHNPQSADSNGSKSIFLNIEKNFRQREKYGNLVNKNFFAYKNGIDSGGWVQFSPKIGNPGYGHLLHTGVSPVDGYTSTYSRGTWIPLLVPYFGDRTYSTKYEYIVCDPECPVELSIFRGYTRNKANELVWETASEIENYGFFVERKIEDDEWRTLPGFENGHGTSNIPHEYYFTDKDVEANKTYHYRLRQLDLNGTQSCDDFSGIVTLTFLDKEGVILEQNSPNPFSDATKIRFSLPEKTFVRLDILNIYGDVISVLLSQEMSAGNHEIKWEGKDVNGRKVPQGAYIYHLKAGNEVFTGKMILISEK